jgi:hypothetical protein
MSSPSTASVTAPSSPTLPCPWSADQGVRELEWGSGAGYRGLLRVQDASSGSSEIQVSLSVPDERVASWPDAEAEVRRGMEEAFDRLSTLLGR